MNTRTTPKRPWKAAWIAAFACSGLFLAFYSATNAYAATLGELPTWHFDWETSIPVVPWMIVPYMSIDAFFFLAPFFCGNTAEIKMLAKRLGASIVIAGTIFMLFPLQLGFERPEVEGVFAPVFEFLHGFDQPHNLFPSLHITLIFVLRWTYHRHVRGGWRVLMHVWFALVTLSTLFTHQHHVVDLIGGLALALLVFYIFPTGRITRADATVSRPPSRELATRYGLAAAIALLVAAAVAPWSWTAFGLLVWGAASLFLVAAGYRWLGPRVFRKYAGYLSIPSRLILGPYLLGLWLIRFYYFRKASTPFAEIIPGVFLGRLPNAEIIQQLRERGVQAVLDVCAEHSEHRPLEMDYHFAPIMDLVAPEPGLLEATSALLDRASAQGPVYVHCALGYERSGMVVAHWLARSSRLPSLEAAAHAVATARPAGVSAERLLRGLQTIT